MDGCDLWVSQVMGFAGTRWVCVSSSKHSLLSCGGIRLCSFEIVIQRSIEVLSLPGKRALRIDIKGSMALPTKGIWVRSPETSDNPPYFMCSTLRADDIM